MCMFKHILLWYYTISSSHIMCGKYGDFKNSASIFGLTEDFTGILILLRRMQIVFNQFKKTLVVFYEFTAHFWLYSSKPSFSILVPVLIDLPLPLWPMFINRLNCWVRFNDYLSSHFLLILFFREFRSATCESLVCLLSCCVAVRLLLVLGINHPMCYYFVIPSMAILFTHSMIMGLW